MALEDIKRNAKRDIESSIKEYLKGHKDQSTYNYIISKIDLAAQVSLITVDQTKEYMAQLGKNI
ncbi:MAG TPA: hypothetical protein VEA58_14300 [Anaerovoracaceae bacterium]|nr:hypothetical protein [Anaerovoracaceae bacterium]